VPVNVEPPGAVNVKVTVCPDISDPEAGVTEPDTVIGWPRVAAGGETEQVVVDPIFVTVNVLGPKTDAP
jgi:hypothetical protein